MNVKHPLSEDEIAIFRDAIGDVKPLRSDRVAQRPCRPAPHASQTRLDETRVIEELLSTGFDGYDLQPGDALVFCRAGVQKAILRKLRKGQYRVGAELDLHGMTARAAQQALMRFIRQAKAADAGCVRIVHGKGRRSSSRGPVIKPLVACWLRRSRDVLAFCSARPVDGGTGAVYVLLKSA
jgi:DNA-nicking Smr family endonuclease